MSGFNAVIRVDRTMAGMMKKLYDGAIMIGLVDYVGERAGANNTLALCVLAAMTVQGAGNA